MNLLQMSISAATLILAVVVIRALTINRLPKKTFLVLWGVVLCRMLIPFSIPSPFSIYTLFNRTASSNSILVAPVLQPVVQAGVSETISPISQTATNSPAIPWLFIVWAIGLVVCTLFYSISYIRCCSKFAMAIPLKHAAVSNWLSHHPAIRNIEVRQSDRIAAPLTYGIWKPVILMPKQFDLDNDKQLAYILTHEYIHIRRFDTVTKLLLTAALCIHWFNPLAWVMFCLANRDMELSCDEAVVRSFGEKLVWKSGKAGCCHFATALANMQLKKE